MGCGVNASDVMKDELGDVVGEFSPRVLGGGVHAHGKMDQFVLILKIFLH